MLGTSKMEVTYGVAKRRTRTVLSNVHDVGVEQRNELLVRDQLLPEEDFEQAGKAKSSTSQLVEFSANGYLCLRRQLIVFQKPSRISWMRRSVSGIDSWSVEEQSVRSSCSYSTRMNRAITSASISTPVLRTSATRSEHREPSSRSLRSSTDPLRM